MISVSEPIRPRCPSAAFDKLRGLEYKKEKLQAPLGSEAFTLIHRRPAPFLGVLGVVLVIGLDAAEASSPNARPARISSRALLSSPFARAFRAGNYAEALTALDALAQTYPDDPLLLRYRARVLTHLGRTQEAIAIYRRLLADNPQHVPTRLFLGQAYRQAGDAAAAAEEWQWVAQHSESAEYRRWAEAQLHRLRVGAQRPPRTPRPYLLAVAGLKYDSNPLFKPNDKALASSGDEKAGFLGLLDLTLGYPVLLKPDTRLDALYLGRQITHDGETDDVDFTSQGLGLNAKHLLHAGDRTYLLDGLYTTRVNFLRSDLFSVVNRFLLSVETAVTPHTRTSLHGRAALSHFGPDGSNPPQTSRDGFRGGLGLTQFFYTKDFRRHLFVSHELNLQETRGANFTRRGMTSRIGLFTAVDCLPKTDWRVSTGFEWGRYPRFTSLSSLETTRRRDARFDVYTAVTHHWTRSLATRVLYQFIQNDNRNDVFDRTRHIAGVEMLMAY